MLIFFERSEGLLLPVAKLCVLVNEKIVDVSMVVNFYLELYVEMWVRRPKKEGV